MTKSFWWNSFAMTKSCSKYAMMFWERWGMKIRTWPVWECLTMWIKIQMGIQARLIKMEISWRRRKVCVEVNGLGRWGREILRWAIHLAPMSRELATVMSTTALSTTRWSPKMPTKRSLTTSWWQTTQLLYTANSRTPTCKNSSTPPKKQLKKALL